VLGGVCAGVARSAGLDPLLLRIAVVAVTVLTGGAGLLAYLAAWVLIPREDAPAPEVAAGPATPVDVRAAWSAAGRELKSLAGELRRPAPADAPDAADMGATGAADMGATGAADMGAAGAADMGAAGGASPGTTAPPGPPSSDVHEAVLTGTGMPSAEAAPPDGEPADPAPGAVPAQRSPLEAADDAATALGDRLRAPEVQAGARKAATSVSQALAASVDELGRRVRRDRS